MVLERESDYCLFTIHGAGSTPERAGCDCWEALVGLVGASDVDDRLPMRLEDDLAACLAMMQAAREWAKGEGDAR